LSGKGTKVCIGYEALLVADMSNISIAWEIKFCCARNRLFWFLKNAVRPFFVAKLNPMCHPIIFAYLMQIPFQNCFIYFRMVIPSYIPI